MTLWRICRKRHLATALSGEGALRGPGRWNSTGVPIAYTSEHLSLAALEVFVHILGPEEPEDLMAFSAEVPVSHQEIELQKRTILAALPSNWKHVNNPETRALGDKWAMSRSSLTMFVPSAIIDQEWNILINPLHPKARSIDVLDAKPFRFDERMFKSAG